MEMSFNCSILKDIGKNLSLFSTSFIDSCQCQVSSMNVETDYNYNVLKYSTLSLKVGKIQYFVPTQVQIRSFP